MSELPIGWEKAKLDSLADFVMGQAPPGSACNKSGQGTPFVKAGEFGELRPIIREWTTQPLKFARKTDVLICVVGATSGKINLGEDCAIGRSVAAIRPNEALEQFYLYNFLQTKILDLRGGASGSAQGVISKDALNAIDVPLPPAPEQRRIVAKLDSLSAYSSRARDELNHVPSLVENYKRAILAKAFSGALTADWRRANSEDEALVFSAVGNVSKITSGVGFPKDRQGKTLGDFPFAKVSDISRAVAAAGGRLRTAVNYVDHADLPSLRATPVPLGSTVFAKIGEALRLNRRAITEVPVILDNNCMALTPILDEVRPAYLYYFMQTINLSPFAVATAVPSVRRGDVAGLEIFKPTHEEQDEIIRRIETAFAWLDNIVTQHAHADRLLPRLDRAILAKAFRGELVPQDPNDEPAAKLLERIGAERAKRPQRRGRAERRKPVGVAH